MTDSHVGAVMGVFAEELSALKFLEKYYSQKGNYKLFVYKVQP